MYALLMILAAVFFLGETALHILYGDSFLDEVVFLAGGRGFLTGRFVPYIGGFQTNYPPVGFYVFGIVQKFTGPSFYMGRLEAAAFLALALVLVGYVTHKIAGRMAALIAVWLTISTMFLMRSYVMAVPSSLVLLFIISSVAVAGSGLRPVVRGLVSGGFMALAALTRQDMVPLILVLLVYLFRVDPRRHAVVGAAAGTLTVSIAVSLPFFPDLLRVFLATPGWNLLGDSLLVQQPAWMKAPVTYVWYLYARFYRWLLFLFAALVPALVLGFRSPQGGLRRRLAGQVELFGLVCGLFAVNFLTHVWPPSFCPYCTLAYGVYYWPLGAIVLGVGIAVTMADVTSRVGRAFITGVVCLAVVSSVAAGAKTIGIRPGEQPPLEKITRTAQRIAAVTEKDDKVLMLGTHHPLYIAERQFFPPLVNWYYSYRPSHAEERLKRLALWNLRMLDEWLSRDATVVIFKRGGVSFPEDHADGREIASLIERRVQEFFVLREVIEDAWEMPLVVYRRVSSRDEGR